MKHLNAQMKHKHVHIKRVSKQLTNKVSPSRLQCSRSAILRLKQSLLCPRAPSNIRLPLNDVCPKLFAEQGPFQQEHHLTCQNNHPAHNPHSIQTTTTTKALPFPEPSKRHVSPTNHCASSSSRPVGCDRKQAGPLFYEPVSAEGYGIRGQGYD